MPTNGFTPEQAGQLRKHGPAPSCLCGSCGTCRRRTKRRKHEQRKRDGTAHTKRKVVINYSADVTDAELDIKALAWLERMECAS